MTRPARRAARPARAPRPAAPRLRAARLADAAAIAAVMRASIRGLARGTYPARTLEAWSTLPPLYHAWAMSAGGERYLVAEARSRVVAFGARRGREITSVFVSPSHARSGLGRRLLARLERAARREGLRSLVVRAALGAAPFYAESGFAGSRRVRVPLPGGAAMPALVMRKSLRAPPRPA